MWIRSKGKAVLKDCSSIEVDEGHVYAHGYLMGEYSTEKRALEVLDMIEDRIMQGTRFDEIQNGKRKTRDFVFQMPQE